MALSRGGKAWITCVVCCAHAMALLQVSGAQILQPAPSDGSGEDFTLLPTTCTSSPHITLGMPFQWKLGNGSVVRDSSCSFWEMEGNTLKQVSQFWTLEDLQYTFYKIGDYQFSCDVLGMAVDGDLTVVSASHTIALCKDCGQTRDTVSTINTGEVLRWTTNDKMCEEVAIKDVKTEETLTMEGSGVDYYLFKEPGSYEVYCTLDSSISCQVTVVDGENTTVNSDDDDEEKDRYKAVICIHAGLMALSFGVLLPLGAFLAHYRVLLVHKITQPLGILLAISGFVFAIVYVELNGREHFDELIHGVLGLVLVLLVLLVMPALLIRRKWRCWHRRCGHIIAFFGMGNVLLGLTILPGPHATRLTTTILYGLWLLCAFLAYVLSVPLRHKDEVGDELGEESSNCKPQFIELSKQNSKGSVFSFGRRGSETSGRGPQPLSKNVIQEDKMIELRKKSMDPNEAQRQREQLDKELHLQLQQRETMVKKTSKPDIDSPELETTSTPSVESYPGPVRKGSLADLESSHAVLLPFHLQRSSAPEPESPVSPPPLSCPLHSARSPMFHILESSDSSDSSESEEREDTILREVSAPPNPSVHIHRAHTFNVGRASVASDSDDAHSRVGSLRITRHSRRAKNKSAEDVFGFRSSTSPALHVHSPTPPESNENPVGGAMQTATATRERRRKQTVVLPPTFPPHILTTPGSPSPLQSALKKQPSQDESDGHFLRQGSPNPSSGGSTHGNSPRPRKKKVSVAQIEATVVPPTPVRLEPPGIFGRSNSDSTLRVEQDVFADNALRTVMQISQDAIICANNVGDIIFWSAGAVKMFGYTPGEAIGSSLEMIIPHSFKEKHRNGITKRTEDTLKYIRKHSYAPEEQKHARLYAVRGISRNGHEFPVEVNVTSFVIDGEIFFTGVITEVTPRNTRAGSVSSSFSEMSHESSLKQRAMAVGAQMKIAHQLRSAEHISQRELERVLAGSFQAAKFEVPLDQMEQMVNGIMKAGDPEGSGVIAFEGLIQLLSKHRLYISESGLIARYGKTKGIKGGGGGGGGRESTGDGCRGTFQALTDKLKQFVYMQRSSISWFLVYLFLNVLLLLVGVMVTDREDWAQWAYGTGPVLSMNCVLVLLPTLSSAFHAMRGSRWMNSVFPLSNLLPFHLIIAGGIAFWTAVHILTHFTSMAIDSRHGDNQSSLSTFESEFNDHLCPTITGIIVLVVFLALSLSSLRPLRRLFRFIPFHVIHWVGAGLFYIMLLFHGDDYFNPSFWKWLLPAAFIVVLERIHRHLLVYHYKLRVKSAGPYDDITRVGVIELEKPEHFKFEEGQYVVINLPWIAYFNWHACYISSGPKDDRLTIYIPKDDDIWFTEVIAQLRSHPYKRHPTPPLVNGKPAKPVSKVEETKEDEEQGRDEEEEHISIQLTGPFGTGHGTIFDYKIATLVCGGVGPHVSKPIIKRFLDYRKGTSCRCGCHPTLTKLYFVWVTPSGNDFEWFTDYLSDLCEDENIQRYLDIRVFLTNIDSPPDELASALLQLGLKTAGENCSVRRPSQPQLNNLYQMTSYGVPDFDSLLDYMSVQHSNLWTANKTEFGVFTVGGLHYNMHRDLTKACTTHSKPGQLTFKQQHVIT